MTGEDRRATAGGAGGPGVAGSVCHQCGATGQTDLFCDSCGAVLRARTSEDAPSARTPGSPAAPSTPPGSGGSFDASAPASGPAPQPLTSNSEIAAVPGQPANPAAGSRSAFTPVPYATPTPLPVSLTETNGAGWDAAAEWGHILSPDSAPAVDQPTDVPAQRSAPNDAAPPAAPPAAEPAPRTRGPYEFTSRRVDSAGEAAARQNQPEQQQGAAGVLSSLEGTVPVADEVDAEIPLAALGEDLGPSRSLDAPPRSSTATTPKLPPSVEPFAPSASELHLRARELIVPVADNAAVDERIVPVPPGMPQPTRPSVRTPDLPDIVGGIPCPWCSTPNPVDRHYCRRCAMSLAAGPAAARRRTWWRRLVDWRRREVPYAGQRPRLRQGVGRLVRRVVLLALLVFVIVEISLNASTGATDVEDHFATPVQVYADKITASSQDPKHPAKLLGDGYNTTWWGSDVTGENTGVSVTAAFDQPIDLMDVIVTPGATTQEDTFTSESRPETMGVTLYKADGTSTQSTISFNDSVGAETFKLRGNDIVKIQFTVKSVFTGNSAADTTELAITQLEFFARNASHS
jgi:hypothetical protein